ncbi:MAG: MFS transporter [Deltaproteobacteria bacterium]|nr:MFS transporter [Deltaproteobacteria bacterium]
MKIFLLMVFWMLWYLNFCARTVVAPLLPVIEDEFYISHALAGSLCFFISLGNTSALFLSGWLSLKIGSKKAILSSYLFLVAAFYLLHYAGTYRSFAVFCFLTGLGGGIYFPCAIPLITSIINPRHWGKAIAFHETAPNLNILTIPLLIALAYQLLPWRQFFVILSGACLVMVICFWIFAPDERPREGKTPGIQAIFGRHDFWIMAILWIFAGAATAGFYNIIPLFLVKEKGMALEVANSILGYSRIGGFLLTAMAGFFLDRYSVKKIMLITLVITGVSTIGMSVAQTFALLVTMLVVQATVSVVFFPVAILAVSKMTTLNERGIFTATLMGTSSVMGFGLTPVIIGGVADRWNFQVGIMAIGVMVMLVCLLVRYLKDMNNGASPLL